MMSPCLRGLLPRLHSLDDLARRNACHEWQAYDDSACGFDFFATVNLIEGIVAAFDQNIGQQLTNQRSRRDVLEYCHVIDGFESRKNFYPVALVHQRTSFAFQLAD